MIHISHSTPSQARTGKRIADAFETNLEPIVSDESTTSTDAVRKAWLHKLLVSMSALAFVYVNEE